MSRLALASTPAAVAPWSPPAGGFDASVGRPGESAAARATGHPGAAGWSARVAGVLAALGLSGAGTPPAAPRPGGDSWWGRGEGVRRGGAPGPTSPGLAAMPRSRRVRRLMYELASRAGQGAEATGEAAPSPGPRGEGAGRNARSGALSGRLMAVAARLRERPGTTLGELLDGLGPAGFALVLVLLAVPALMPLPLLPNGMVCGLLLALVAPQMARARARRVWVPLPLRRWALPAAPLAGALERAAPRVARVEALLKPGRLRALSGAAARPALAAVVLLMGLLIAAPVPFGNLPPAAALIVLATGLAARDGGAVLVGLGVSAAATAWVAALAWGVTLAAGWGFTGAF